MISSAVPWIISFSAKPPDVVARDADVVRVELTLGLGALDALVADGSEVGPVKYCKLHHRLLVPVERDSAHRWMAAHSECVPADTYWTCGAGGYSGCPGLWLTCPDAPLVAATATEVLYDALSRTRAELRDPLSPFFSRQRQACRV